MWWDVIAARCSASATIAYAILRRRRVLGPRHGAGSRSTCSSASPSSLLVLEAHAAHDRLDHAGRRAAVPRLRVGRPVAAAAVDAPRLRRRAHVGHLYHDARRHLRHRGRRVVVAHHPVHDLRRVPAAVRRRQVLHRLLASPRWAASRNGAGRTVVLCVVPARRAVGLGRRHHRDDRHRRLSDAGEARATARTPRAACSPPAGSARSSRRRCWAPPPS